MSANRKKRKISFKLPKIKKEKTKETVNVSSEDTSDPDKEEQSNLQIVNGSRKKKRIIKLCVLGVIVLIIITVIILNALTPTGIVEYMQNAYALRGEGKTPVSVYAVNSTDFASKGNVVCTVNESYYELYNSSGKLVYAVSHGMSDATVRLSASRVLLFDRDRYLLKVFNYSGELFSREFDQKIVSADIGRDGTFAVVTGSDKYVNSVYVYNDDNELEFSWDCSYGYVIDAAVYNKGDKIAVAVVNASGGSYKTNVYIITSGGKIKYTYEFSGLVSSLTANDDYVLANGFDCAYTIPWNGKGYVTVPVNGVVRYFDTCLDGRSVVVSGRENNSQNSVVTIISSGGSIKNTFNFGAKLNDAGISEAGIVLLGDDAAYIYEPGGKEKASYALSKKPDFAALTDNGDLLVLNTSELDLIE